MSDKKTKTKNPAFVIMRRELRSYFSGPIGYIVTGLFLVINGLLFFAALMKLYEAIKVVRGEFKRGCAK